MRYLNGSRRYGLEQEKRWVADIVLMTGGLDSSFLWHQLQTVSDLILTGASQSSVDP